MTTSSEPRGARLAIPEPVLGQLESHGLPVTDTLDRVEVGLHAQVRSSHAFVDEAARYLLAAGGKRFRPLMVALAGHLGPDGQAGGVQRSELVDAGVIVELVHLATLYHDDVIDEAAARRGAPSANHRWDNTVAILTGDYLFSCASALSADLGVEVTRIMARTLAALCEGQIREVQGSMSALLPEVPTIEPTLEHYLEAISGKTASLIATSCRYGALLSGVDEDGVEAAARYGWNVGMAFQLSDDVLDIDSDQATSGKTPGTDLKEGVRTLPVLYALEDDADGELAGLLGDGAPSDEQVARAIELLRGSDAIDRARDTAGTYVTAAVSELERFGDRRIVTALTRLAEYALHRAG
ncbi:polyprenyl synthetase family protein [Nitriliruptor alkaliphilus]|uniref:polyprenyl synthetase family protein n=1 Tax=Nitriliruptor alkaliphilus TaxID=427918 RepID=UPI000697B201|nr:polyprenyl synthetase family protein [Nitriliruptor alkaliphilus]